MSEEKMYDLSPAQASAAAARIRPLPRPPLPVQTDNSTRFIRFLLDHNPFYLLSAVSMLLGTFLLNSAMEVRAGELGKLLLLLGTINLYEVLLIGLGLYLFLQRGLRRDARLLIILQSVFLADATFLVAETTSMDPFVGGLINITLLILGIAKVLVVFHVLRLEKSLRTLGFLLVQLGALYTLPIVLPTLTHNGTLSSNTFYPLWWLIFLIPVAYQILSTSAPASAETQERERAPELRVAYAVVPWLGLVAHVAMLTWVYHAEFVLANLTPILLAIAVALLRVKAGSFMPLNARRGLQMLLCLFAFFVSFAYQGVSGFDMQWINLTLSPPVLSTFACAVVLAWCILDRSLPYVLGGLLTMAMLKFAWPVLEIGVEYSLNQLAKAVRWSLGLIPQTGLGWGVLAIIGSFILLAMGALVSMTRTRPTLGKTPE